VNRSENLDGFHFHNHFVLDDQVGPKSGVEAFLLIHDIEQWQPRATAPPLAHR
jgi:hypothetical protein